MTRLYWRLGFLVIACSISSIQVQAGPITYTITTTATGTLGASPFTNAAVNLTLTGSTSAVAFGPSPLNDFLTDPGTATINIAGLGSATLTGSIEILSSFNTLFNGSSAVVIGEKNNVAGTDVSGILWTFSPALFGYNLQSALGPISGTGSVANGGPADGFFTTTAGNLQFAAGQGRGAGSSTFTAGTVPEPASWILMLGGVAALVAVRRLRLGGATPLRTIAQTSNLRGDSE